MFGTGRANVAPQRSEYSSVQVDMKVKFFGVAIGWEHPRLCSSRQTHVNTNLEAT